jgi:hypothetical protein
MTSARSTAWPQDLLLPFPDGYSPPVSATLRFRLSEFGLVRPLPAPRGKPLVFAVLFLERQLDLASVAFLRASQFESGHLYFFFRKRQSALTLVDLFLRRQLASASAASFSGNQFPP